VEKDAQDAHASKNRTCEIELEQNLAGKDQRNSVISASLSILLHVRLSVDDKKKSQLDIS
jgi:hypothetical protein